ncbi:hypothetical protein [Archangium lansingense]|uniref:Uncharacterized protein n=1 Tax=Archangium lansingense TaxID=2995310 RepID=A0ABT4APU3_9BACT|nr:hypothetical protein [Archangium lansinium]MCY1083712.1 hypothetical protein [Archangium lansinium]
MSFEFIIPGGGPDSQLLRDAGAEFKELAPEEGPGWLAWRGRPARGVFVFEEEGTAHIKLMTLSSDDDVALAQELAVRLARARGMPIDVEEPPEGIEPAEGLAPAAPEGFEGLFLFAPEEVEKWPSGWFHDQNIAGFLGVSQMAKMGGASLVSGPFRRTFVGRQVMSRLSGAQAPKGFLSKLFRRNELDPDEAVPKLLEVLMGAQERLMSELPLRPRLMTSDVKLPRTAKWSASAMDSLMPPSCHERDVMMFGRELRDEAHYTIALPGPALLPVSDYVALRESETAWACVPFHRFLELLGAARVRWVDECTVWVDPPRGNDWTALMGLLIWEVTGKVAHQDELLRTSQELVAAALANERSCA